MQFFDFGIDFDSQHVSNVICSLISTVVVAVVGYLYYRIKYYLDAYPAKRILGAMLKRETEVKVAVPSIEFKSFAVYNDQSKTSNLPSNVKLIGLLDAFGISSLESRLPYLFHRMKISLCSANYYTNYDSTIISVGGASVNSITKKYLYDFKLDAKFKMHYPKHYATDGENVFHPNHDKETGALSLDYGFIIATKNPFNTSKYIIIVQGIWPHGTYGAIYSLLHPKDTNLLHEYRKLKNKSKGFVAVVEVPVIDEFSGKPKAIYVRNIATDA